MPPDHPRQASDPAMEVEQAQQAQQARRANIFALLSPLTDPPMDPELLKQRYDAIQAKIAAMCVCLCLFFITFIYLFIKKTHPLAHCTRLVWK
jgi:hypothetical protein